MTTTHHRDGSPFEDVAGYARALRRGNRIEVSGTTVDGDGLGGAAETHRQTGEAIERGLAAVRALGGAPEDVVRTRVFLGPTADWRAASEAHAAALGSVRPANTMLYVAGLLGDGAVVEVELEAEVVPVDGGDGRPR